ncbi:MAG: hypothetical protein Q8Q09_21040 [Deltaproteobacteria bacterium]|nr:hypothetical protein [Deltaproteobacteria bacterium]
MTTSRPPAQLAMVRAGFRAFGAAESGGRLPTALLATFATLALVLAIRTTSDARTAGYAGIAYASMPLVFMNARQMFGGGVTQSAVTLLFSAAIVALFCRPPPESNSTLQSLYKLRALLPWVAAAFAVWAGGALLGAVPVLVGAGIVPVLRGREDDRPAFLLGGSLTLVGALLGALALRAAMKLPLESYSWLVGAGPDLTPPAVLPTYEALVEHVGHAIFPWTGIVAFGLARLAAAAPMSRDEVSLGGELVSRDEAWRDSGLRLAALGTAAVAFGLQGFTLQQFGPSAFVAPAALAVAAGIALRDAERSAIGWRVVTAGVTFFTAIMVRDYFQFPKSSYAALGLLDGGPAFPEGFRWAQDNQPNKTIVQWFAVQKGASFGHILRGTAPGEAYFVVMGLTYMTLALPALFQGAGTIQSIGWTRPIRWMREVELAAAEERKELEAKGRWGWYSNLTGTGILANFRLFLLISSGTLFSLAVYAWSVRGLGTQQRAALTGVGAIPIAVIAGVYTFIALWNLFAAVGQPGKALAKLLGSRVAITAVAAVFVAVIFTRLYIPALSEHLSPRGVWTVIKQLRRGDEPVARYGGTQDRNSAYYADFPVTSLSSEPEAVAWLQQANNGQRRFMLVDAPVFSQFNRAWRFSQPQGRRQNLSVVDASNSNLYVVASDATERGSRNPLDDIVMSTDRLLTRNDHYHAHGRHEGTRFIEEPARFDENLEFLGYNLDSKGMSYVPVGGSFKIKYHFRVLRDMTGSWQIFVHIDGQCPRINGDHEPGAGRYPVRNWLAGDIIHDEQEITIPGYCRSGTYHVYMGFYQGDDRMRIQGGEHDRENRVVAARVVVR